MADERFFEERMVGDDVLVLTCKGRVTIAGGAQSLRDKIREVAKRGHKKVILHMGDTAYMDSYGIGELTSGFTALANQGAQLVLLSLTKRCKDMLRITKLYTVFEIFEDEAEAVSYLHLGYRR